MCTSLSIKGNDILSAIAFRFLWWYGRCLSIISLLRALKETWVHAGASKMGSTRTLVRNWINHLFHKDSRLGVQKKCLWSNQWQKTSVICKQRDAKCPHIQLKGYIFPKSCFPKDRSSEFKEGYSEVLNLKSIPMKANLQFSTIQLTFLRLGWWKYSLAVLFCMGATYSKVATEWSSTWDVANGNGKWDYLNLKYHM